MGKLKGSYVRHNGECYAEQECLNDKRNEFRKALIDIASIAEVKPEELSNAIEDCETGTHDDKSICASY